MVIFLIEAKESVLSDLFKFRIMTAELLGPCHTLIYSQLANSQIDIKIINSILRQKTKRIFR